MPVSVLPTYVGTYVLQGVEQMEGRRHSPSKAWKRPSGDVNFLKYYDTVCLLFYSKIRTHRTTVFLIFFQSSRATRLVSVSSHGKKIPTKQGLRSAPQAISMNEINSFVDIVTR